MTFKRGDIVTGVEREKRDMRIHAFTHTTVTLEWWDVAGREELYISEAQLNDATKFRFVSDKPTEDFLNMKSVWDEAKKRHKENYPNGMSLQAKSK